MPFNPTRPHGVNYGESLAAFRQDGKDYTADGQEVVVIDGRETIKGAKPDKETSQAEKQATAQRKAAEKKAKADALAAAGNDSPTDTAGLGKLHVSKVKKIFVEMKGPEDLMSGEGAKGRMIAWMLANQ